MKKILSLKKHMPTFSAVLIVVAIGATASIFQNCSQPLGSSDAVDGETAAAVKLDFAYDAQIDQIAYMSCPLVGTTPSSAYFSLRAGAYRKGGLKLSDSFFQTNSKRSPQLMADMLTKSSANSNTVLQLAVRQVGNLNSLVIAGSTPVPQMDFDTMLDILGTMDMSTSLVNRGFANNAITGTRTRYLRNGTYQGAHLEGSLQFATASGIQSSVRDGYLANSKAVLAVTFSEPGTGTASAGTTITNARTPATALAGVATASPTPMSSTGNTGSAYGMGYFLSFQPPSPVVTMTPAFPTSILTSVGEASLLNLGAQSAATAWNCPSTLRFQIVRDVSDTVKQGSVPNTPSSGISNCVAHPDPAAPSADLLVARHSLRAEDWYIDMDNHCIIPKRSVTSSCYGNVNYVNYNVSTTCGIDPTTSGATLAAPTCVAFASVCYRMPQ